MGIAVPYLQKLQKEGESGRKKITQITRWLTIIICVIQAPAYLFGLSALGVPDSAFILGRGPLFIFSSVVILVTGTIFAMWLGEKITDRGIGNGISLLIMVGIIASLPLSFAQEFVSRVTENNGGLMMILIELVLWVVIILLSVLLVMAVRRIPVQYARRSSAGNSNNRAAYGSRQYIPLKLNDAINNIINGKRKTIDIGLINGQYFINVVGIGFDGFVNIESKKIKFLRGKPVFIAAVLKTLNKWRAVPIKIIMDDKEFISNSYLICIANGWSVGGGLSMTPNAKLDDGYFDICHLKEISPMKIIFNFPKLTNGKIEEIEEAKIYQTKKIIIKSEYSLPIHVDGEVIKGKNNFFEIELIKNSFEIWNRF